MAQAVEIRWKAEQKEHKGHNLPYVPAGAVVYGVKDKGLFFVYAYKNEEYAKKIAGRLKREGVADTAANWRKFPTCVSGREED